MIAIRIEDLKTNEDALDYIDAVRNEYGFECPRCHCRKGYQHKKRRRLIECAQCGKQTSPTSNTIYHGTKKPLLDLQLLNMMGNGCNLSTRALSQLFNIGYSTMWHHAHVAREALKSVGKAQKRYIHCDKLKPALFKRSKEKPKEIPPTPKDILFREEATSDVVSAAITFFLLVFTGVSRKFAQSYVSQFGLYINPQARELKSLVQAALNTTGQLQRQLRSYRSPPVVLIDCYSFKPVAA